MSYQKLPDELRATLERAHARVRCGDPTDVRRGDEFAVDALIAALNRRGYRIVKQTEQDAHDILTEINEIAKLARASGRCDGSYLAANNEEHDRLAHEAMQAIRGKLGFPPRTFRYHLPE